VYDPATNTTHLYNLGNIAWIISATALVWIMIPGVGFFYSGLLRRKNALSMIWLSMVTLATVSFQVSRHTSVQCAMISRTSCSGSFGGVYSNDLNSSSFTQYRVSRYSLAFSETASVFIGDLSQYSSLLVWSVPECDHNLQLTLASREFYSSPPSGARQSRP
jgi:ammonia channel protein AmtB